MITWVYAYLHQIYTISKQEGYSKPGPRFYVIEDISGSRVIENAQTTLSALNAVGADGWLVQLPETWSRSNIHNDQAEILVNEKLNEFEAAGGAIYLMRRPGTEIPRFDN